MASIEDYLRLLDIGHAYELDGEEVPLESFDGVSVPVGSGDREFYGWALRDDRAQYHVVLSQDTPGETEELRLDVLAGKLESKEYTPTVRTDSGYIEAGFR